MVSKEQINSPSSLLYHYHLLLLSLLPILALTPLQTLAPSLSLCSPRFSFSATLLHSVAAAPTLSSRPFWVLPSLSCPPRILGLARVFRIFGLRQALMKLPSYMIFLVCFHLII